MQAPGFGLVVEYTKDIERATRFYVEVLGLRPERVAPMFVQFEHFAIASDASLGGKDQPELYWLVEDAEAAWRTLSAKAKVVMALEQKPFGKVFAIEDADGRPRYLLELAKTRPSQAV